MPRSGGGGGGRSGGGRSSGGGGGRSPSYGGTSRPYSTGRPSSSSAPPPPKPKPGNPPNQPSMLKHMAATAVGVAGGSLLASAILGAARESIPDGVECSDRNCKIPENDPCAKELRNFIDCAYNAVEMTACDGYNTLLKECRRFTDRLK